MGWPPASSLRRRRPWVVSKASDSPQPPDGLPTITTQGGGEMVLIPAGSFEMGSRYGREEEKPVHKVWVDSFLIDRHEVTQAEFEELGKIEAFPNPSHFQGRGPAGGAGDLAPGGPLLQRPVASRRTPAVLQRGHRGV